MPRYRTQAERYKARDRDMDSMRAIVDKAETENRELTAAEQQKFDRLSNSVRLIGDEIRQSALDDDTRLNAPLPTIAARAQGRPPRGPEANTEFESLAEFVHVAAYKPNDQRLDYQPFQVRGEMEMETGSSGGFAVPRQFHADILSVDPAQAGIRPRATILPAGYPPDASISVPCLDQSGTSGPENMFAGVTLTWTAEGATVNETDADVREVVLTPHEISGLIKVSDKLLRNWQAAGPVISGLFRNAARAAEERAFIQGNGAGRPLGIVNAPASYVVNRVVSNQFNLADLDAMIARLLMRGGEPVWIISQSVMPQLQSMRNYSADSPALGDGALVWNPNRRDDNGMQSLNGYPIVWSERSPTLGSKGDIILADLAAYLIKDGSGPLVAASEHRYFEQNKTAIKLVWNVDAKPWLSSTLDVEDDYDVSPFVVLDVPA